MITKDEIAIVKRVLQYVIVVICCLFLGGCIAIDLLDVTQIDLLTFISKPMNWIYLVIIIISYVNFLGEYVCRYSNCKNITKYNICFGIQKIILGMSVGIYIVVGANSFTIISLAVAIVSASSIFFYNLIYIIWSNWFI